MLVVAWIAHSRRSQLLAEALGAPLYQVQALKRHYALAPVRYVIQSLVTLRILFKNRPSVVLVQNPPIFAVLTVFFYSQIFGAHYIIDAHTGALLAPWWKWSLPLHVFLSRRAITTIVTNEHLASIIKGWKANSLIIADIPTSFQQGNSISLAQPINFAVVNTFSPDEPLVELLKAAGDATDIHFYVTGDVIRAEKGMLANNPENVTFTGFLPDSDYIGLLRAAVAIIALTTDDHTMQRGACEAMALGKPIITSDWPLLRTFFSKGTIHVDNTAQDIRRAILQMQIRYKDLEQEIVVLREEHLAIWEKQKALLIQLVEPYIVSEPNVYDQPS